jgi:hypothetical protein
MDKYSESHTILNKMNMCIESNEILSEMDGCTEKYNFLIRWICVLKIIKF